MGGDERCAEGTPRRSGSGTPSSLDEASRPIRGRRLAAATKAFSCAGGAVDRQLGLDERGRQLLGGLVAIATVGRQMRPVARHEQHRRRTGEAGEVGDVLHLRDEKRITAGIGQSSQESFEIRPLTSISTNGVRSQQLTSRIWPRRLAVSHGPIVRAVVAALAVRLDRETSRGLHRELVAKHAKARNRTVDDRREHRLTWRHGSRASGFERCSSTIGPSKQASASRSDQP